MDGVTCSVGVFSLFRYTNQFKKVQSITITTSLMATFFSRFSCMSPQRNLLQMGDMSLFDVWIKAWRTTK